MSMPLWMKQMSSEKSNEEFSQLTHDYFKLASMRVMQTLREKFNVPSEDIPTLTIAIFARMLNESIYAVGSLIRKDYAITDIIPRDQLLNLLKVLNGESLNSFDRDDIETDIDKGLKKFRDFIFQNASDFYISPN